ncbi:Hypothetical protein NR1_066 [Escherichia phage vB_Eco_NR1]|nr:Hypothetical protein NR1_066 [Escherichia phage vB_Eco_NR1]
MLNNNVVYLGYPGLPLNKLEGLMLELRTVGPFFWLGVPFSRYSPAWKELYTNAYFEAAIQNKGFRDALQASKGKVLKHSMASGLTKDDTILTEAEFIDVLNLLRDSL